MNEQEIFESALEKDPQQRSIYLNEVCADDIELRERVEELLQVHDHAGEFLQEPAHQILATDCAPIIEQPGAQIGPYKLLQEIGEGGMGVVYLAEQKEPVNRRVALKIIKAGMDTRQVVARFEAERQALAMMDHPNIARVLDAGATQRGRPFFAMELVKGVPITQYCDEKRLTTGRRLELFIPVLQAVQHAHQKGIIHRDLKPSNVLVADYDEQAVPKIIDFGIAKATGQQLTDMTLFTQHGQLVGTLEYMSPEQAKLNQLDVDTRSDIFSLGVLLYELLTGTTPFDRKRLESSALDEILRVIREDEPPSPSTRLSTIDSLPSIAANRNTEPARLRRSLRRELDWIVMKALEKERGRRYETASKFVEDIRHCLNNEPVSACPQSAWYRIRKFIHRNRKAVAAFASLGLMFLIIVGVVAASAGWVARDQAAQAAQRTGQLRQILTTVERLEAEGNLPEALRVARRIDVVLDVGDVDEETQRNAKQTLDDLKLVHRLEELWLQQYDRPGRKGPVGAEQTDREYAQAFGEAGLDVSRESTPVLASRLGSRSPAVLQSLAAALTDWAVARTVVQSHRNKPTDWRPLLDLADAIDPDPARMQLRALIQPGGIEGVELKRLVDSPLMKAAPSLTAVGLATVLQKAGEVDEAVQLLKHAYFRDPGNIWINAVLSDMYYLSHPMTPDQMVAHDRAALAVRPQSAVLWDDLGLGLTLQGKFDEAVLCHRQALALAPQHVQAHVNLGLALKKAGESAAAIEAFRDALRINPDFAVAHFNLGDTLWDTGRRAEGTKSMERAASLGDVDARVSLGYMLLHSNRRREAIQHLREAVKQGRDPATLVMAHSNLGCALFEEGQSDQGIDHLRMAVAADPRNDDVRRNLCFMLEVSGQVQEAIEGWRYLINRRPNDATCLNALAWTLATNNDLALRKPHEALRLARRAVQLDPQWQHQDTLSVAAYRTGAFLESLLARKEKMDATDGGDCGDKFWLAMIHAQCGQTDQGRIQFDQAMIDFDSEDAPDETLTRLRQEAESTLNGSTADQLPRR